MYQALTEIDLKGQWSIAGIGDKDEPTGAHGYLNLEYYDNQLKGRIQFRQNVQFVIVIYAEIEIGSLENNLLRGNIRNFQPFNLETRKICTWDDVKGIYPGLAFPSEGTIEGKIGYNDKALRMDITWLTDVSQGKFLAIKGKMPATEATITVNSWDDFKAVAASMYGKFKNPIFRGQKSNQNRLRSSFHRTGRCDLIRFMKEDIHELHHFFCSQGLNTLNLHNGRDFGGMLSLAQHHGYPTPLLDWTESVYVAAYFAFFNVWKNTKDGWVRIFVFDQKNWVENNFQITSFLHPVESISIEKFIPLNNNRALPQQSVFMVTNIDDIEDFIEWANEKDGVSYLIKIDIPASEREVAMKELSYMGITAASLFPGFDGICAALKEKNF